MCVLAFINIIQENMAVYWGMVIAPFLERVFCFSSQKKRNKRIIGVFFLFFLLILMFRAETVGTDLINYKFYFETSHMRPLSAMWNSDIEPLYYLFNYVVAEVTDSYQIFIIVCAVISVLPVWKLYREETTMPLLTIALFLAVAPVHMFFSGIRQAIAIGMSIIAYKFVKEKKFFCFLLIVASAACIHISAVILLLMYPLYYMNITRKKFLLLVPFFLAIFFLKDVFYSIGLNIIGGKYSMKYGGNSVATGAYGMIVLLLIFVVYCYVIPTPCKMDQECIGLRNFLLLCFLIQLFAPVSYMVMRFGYYYHIFIPILIPKIINVSGENKKIARVSALLMTILFVIYFFYKAYFAGQYNMFPYIPFWAEV